MSYKEMGIYKNADSKHLKARLEHLTEWEKKHGLSQNETEEKEHIESMLAEREKQIVEEYEVLYCYEGISVGNETITLQALSSQNVVDMVRNMYGKAVTIIEVKKVMNDWQ